MPAVKGTCTSQNLSWAEHKLDRSAVTEVLPAWVTTYAVIDPLSIPHSRAPKLAGRLIKPTS